MRRPTLYRASVELHVEGRELLGIAVPWEKSAKVTDLDPRTGRPHSYLEAFGRASCDETLRRNPEPRPLFHWHEYRYGPAEAIGTAAFVRSEDSLLYRAYLSRTRYADERLEQVKDGSYRSVSVGISPIQERKVTMPEGLVVMRTEVALKELSLAPTGWGMYPEARVLAMRAGGPTFDAIGDAVTDAVEQSLYPAGIPAGVYVWLRDIATDWAVYCVEGGPEEGDEANVNEASSSYRVSYKVGSDGAVTLGDPEAVQVAYVPANSVPDSATVTGRAEPGTEATTAAAGPETATPRLEAFRRRRAQLPRA